MLTFLKKAWNQKKLQMNFLKYKAIKNQIEAINPQF